MLQDLLQQQNGLQKYIEPFKGFFNKEFHLEESDEMLAQSTKSQESNPEAAGFSE